MTWERFERASKLIGGMTWASLELWLWGARPAALAFITSVLAASEAVHFAKRNTGSS